METDANAQKKVHGLASACSSVPSQMERTKANSLSSVEELSQLIEELVEKNSSAEVLETPVLIGRLPSLELWDDYGLDDRVPLSPKHLFLDDDLDLYLVELPSNKHEYMAEHILLQLRDQCEYIESFGSGRTNHMEADKRISPSELTPNLHLPPGVPMSCLSTLVIEIGLSQNWTGQRGLDAKAKKWFRIRNSLGLQYILCVKVDIDRTSRGITDVSYKLYDLQLMTTFRTSAATHLYLAQNAPGARIQLDARRVLSIPANQPLPQTFIGDSFFINLETTRDQTILRGF